MRVEEGFKTFKTYREFDVLQIMIEITHLMVRIDHKQSTYHTTKKNINYHKHMDVKDTPSKGASRMNRP